MSTFSRRADATHDARIFISQRTRLRLKRMSDLFSAAGLSQSAPHPLADRMRPQTLADVAGQDHLLGPDGALSRLLRAQSIGSLIFWGPPGTGKTTVARLLARETKLALVQISAIHSGVADLKKVLPKCKIKWDGGVIEGAK